MPSANVNPLEDSALLALLVSPVKPVPKKSIGKADCKKACVNKVPRGVLLADVHLCECPFVNPPSGEPFPCFARSARRECQLSPPED